MSALINLREFLASSAQLAVFLLYGAVGGVVTLLVARAVRRYSRVVLAGALMIAALFYVGFAYRGDAGTAWMLVEILGLLGYMGMAAAGVRGSAWWLVAGWTLHPVWDVALHLVGAGRAFTPLAYPVACISWDLIVAGGIVATIRSSRRASRGSTALPGLTA